MVSSKYYAKYKADGRYNTREYIERRRANENKRYARQMESLKNTWTPCRPELNCQVCAANPDKLK
jgi:hypothetical protein